MKRFSLFALVLLFPLTTSAAPLESASDVIATLSRETKPLTFSVTSVRSHDGLRVHAEGKKEGSGPTKASVSIKTEWKQQGQWMRADAELRVRDGKAYFRLSSVTGSADTPIVASFASMLGKWYVLDAMHPGVQRWFRLSESLGAIAPHLSSQETRFAKGYSYGLSSTHDTATLSSAFASSLPSALVPDMGGAFTGKVDTNMSHAFQFAALSFGTAFQAQFQRQFFAVYTETPKGEGSFLPEGLVKDFYFSASTPVAPQPAPQPKAEPTATTSVKASPTARTSFTVSGVSAMARKARRMADAAVIDLHGPDRSNLKLSVLVADGPIEWESAAAFDADFAKNKGILYRYPRPTMVRFSTQDAFSGLEVVFFDAAGRFISAASMPKCRGASCPLYSPDIPATYALEMSTGFIDRTKIGPLWRLSLDWAAKPIPGATSKQVDRSAIRTLENRLQIPAPLGWRAIDSTDGDQSLRILAEKTAVQLRPADIQSALRDREASYRLYTILVDTMRMNDLRYAFIVTPTTVADTFILVLDSYTYAPALSLDANDNGRIDIDEKPAEPGTRYVYPSFTNAMQTAVFDGSSIGEMGVYVPVKDGNGVTVAVLALVK